MFVVRSNRAEELVEHLAGQLRVPLSDPFVPEVVAVQSRGMQRWLSQRLADRLGVWAHAEHPFPRRLIHDVVAAALGEEASEALEPTRRERMAWLLSQRLPELCQGEPFDTVRRYLHDDPGGLKRMQLATQLAERFDQYLVYRPELMLAWDGGAEPGDWQAEAWRAVREVAGSDHVAARIHRALRRSSWPTERLPERVSLFGVATLPPMYLHVLGRLAEHVPVHLYVLAASEQWIADLRPRRRRKRPSMAQVHAEEGNPLLAAWGRLARDLQAVLEELDYGSVERFVAPPPTPVCTTLQLLQADMFHVVARKPATGAAQLDLVPSHDEVLGPVALPADRSLLLHRCHSPMREVEVLASELRRLFDADPGLEPHDVVVMTPDIETYGPLVRAVLGADPDGPEHIPFSVSDRPLAADSVVVEGFLAALAVLCGRLGASEVLDLLSVAPVARRFALSDDDRAAIETYVREAGIRWGVDAADRARFGQPEDAQNTWRFGLDRLLAGIATGAATVVCGSVPYDAVEGEACEQVGKLADAMELLFRFREQLRGERTPQAWSGVLQRLLDALFQVDEAELWGAQRLRQELVDLGADAAEHEDAVSIEVVRWWLEDRLGRERSGHKYLRGGVTVCALLPMRSIPFRVVALLGMGVDAFPRSDRAPAFDRITSAPRAGDRSLREEDRTLFLEAVLSARQHLHISWVGRSIRDNAELPPSVVVAELLDWLDEAFRVASGLATDELVVEHPLQPFDPSYFRDDVVQAGRTSTSTSYARGAVASLQERRQPAAFAGAASTTAEPDLQHVSVDAFVRFLQDPARGFLAGLGIRSPRELPVVLDREPLVPDPLERYQIAADLLDRIIDGGALDELFAVLSKEGQLPAGVAGRVVFEELRPAVEDVADAIARLQQGEPLPPAPIDVEVGGLRITGWAPRAWKGGLVLRQYSRIRARHELGAWIRHLLAQASGVSGPLWLVGRRPTGPRRQVSGFAPVDDPTPILERLVAVWRRGQQQLVAFEPECAKALWGYLQKGGLRDFHRSQIERRFSERCRDDAVWGLAFRGQEGLFSLDADDPDWSFPALVHAITAPLEASRQHGGLE